MSIDPFDKAMELIAQLNAHSVEYVVVGGVALNLHGILRATQDLDIFVRPEASNIGRLRDALRAVWDDPEIDDITADDLLGDYPAISYGPPDGSLGVDILTRLGDLIRYDQLEAEQLTVAGIDVRVVTPSTLVTMKANTVRPQDRADAAALREKFGLDEE